MSSDPAPSSYEPLHSLKDAQMDAAEPHDNIWLSASAGTGKTQVLTARVIRLLLEKNVNPENLLCITYTKAGAAEMAERINSLLANWVQLGNHELFHDLDAIGAVGGGEARARASSLFAKVLDAPGGGMQIMTIHSLCQSLLGSFPEEAGLIPGFKPVEGREQEELFQQVFSELILEAEQSADNWLIEFLQSLSLAMGEEKTLKFLKRCASQPVAMSNVPEGEGAVQFARRIVGLNFDGSVQSMLEQQLSDAVIDRSAIMAAADMNLEWGKGKTGSRGGKRASKIRNWLASSPAERARNIEDLHGCWAKGTDKDEALSASKNHTPMTEAYSELISKLFAWTYDLVGQIRLADYAERLSKALLIGKAFSARYARAKAERGLLDFDDMIRKTAEMLNNGDMANWIRYKLDRQIDHILVDEAQDTNTDQWNIIKALSDDFFSGISAKEEKPRSIFSVGDYKQAIFGFQGTDPKQYSMAGAQFDEKIKATGAELQILELSRSFRSTAPILKFVNAVVENVGHEKFGTSDPIADHIGVKPDCGMVELLKPVDPISDDGSSGDDGESWITKEKVKLAHRIAKYVRALLDEKPILATTGKPVVAGDIMILLRSRGDLAPALVSRLHAEKIPVAGIDRLKLQEPVAVQDMLAAVRFALQPADDLSLACLMVSPLFGWSQEKLLQFGYRPKDKSLWEHLRNLDDPQLKQDLEFLRDILASADFTTNYRFLENLLSGPIQGRRKFIARLGEESLVPIEELLNEALKFEQLQGGSLQAFLNWFESGNDELKRENFGKSDEVRVMTVHGSKGLQAPVVILADITNDPSGKSADSIELHLPDENEDLRLPLLTIKKSEKIGRLETVCALQEQRDLEEHHRLLYVAITRAEERLVLTGALNKTTKNGAKENSWFHPIEAAMATLGCAWEEEPVWGNAMRYRGVEQAAAKDKTDDIGVEETIDILPKWIWEEAPEESRPPRPLVPSHLGDDDYGQAPATADMRIAVEKGRLMHALFERISGGDIDQNLYAARKWLLKNNREDAIDSGKLIADLGAVIENPQWRPFFGPNARAEIPFAAVVGEQVINGRVDRLLIEDDKISVIDFKTGKFVPTDENALPKAFLRQMAHYVAALEVIFAGRKVEASLLFTHGPKLIQLSEAILAPHKPAH